jgi:hypothetical protein
VLKKLFLRLSKKRGMSLLDNLFVNLRIISKIPEGGKISTSSPGAGQIRIEDTKTLDGWLSAGRRRLTGDSRAEAVKVLMQTINDVGEIADNIIASLKTEADTTSQGPGLLNENNKKCHQLQKLSIMLKNSKKGLVNLHKTYADDANVTARLDEVMDKIDQQYEAIVQVLEFMKLRVEHIPPSQPQHKHNGGNGNNGSNSNKNNGNEVHDLADESEEGEFNLNL